jgi:hypothetical protein
MLGNEVLFFFSHFPQSEKSFTLLNMLAKLTTAHTRILLISAVLFLFSVTLYSWCLNSERFTDPDSFYHVAMAEVLRDQRTIPHQFSYLPYTTLGVHYTDHHFLYHILLIPFVTFLPPFVGAKLFTILSASVLIVGIYLFLEWRRVPFAIGWTSLLLVSSSFLFRMGLVKAPSISMLLLLVGALLLTTPRWKHWLLPLSFLFVWSYGGFIVLPLLATCLCIGAVISWLLQRNEQRYDAVKQSLQMLGLIIIGLIAGLLIHPSFPDHLYLIWEQVFVIGILNAQDTIGVGREWYPIAVSDMLLRDSLILIPWFGVMLVSLTRVKKLTGTSLGLTLFSLILLVFTLKSQRYIEYLLPWALLSTALLFRDSTSFRTVPILHWPQTLQTHLQHILKNNTQPEQRFLGISTLAGIASLTLLITFIISIQNISQLYSDLQSGFVYSDTQKSSEAIQQHSNSGEIVFHSDWDMFPQLFYWNRDNSYIIGLDPTFLYRQDPARYWLWHDITTGKQTTNVYETIRDQFKATTVIVEISNKRMMRTIQSDPRFIEIYTDTDYRVFKLQEPDAAS